MTNELDLYNFHRTQLRLEHIYRYGFPPLVEPGEPQSDPRLELAESAEREAAAILLLAGYDVVLTLEHGARFDLLVEGALRVEVKASTWRPAVNGGGRYQCLWHNRADLLLWLCVNAGRWFIIPARDLGDRHNLAVWSKEPADYGGQWAAYLGAWHLIDRELDRVRERGAIPYQERLL